MAVNPYELQRKRVSQETAATGAQENEALKRQFARQGGGMQGGAYIKAQERLSGVQEQNKQKALEGVDIQEAVAQEQKDESQRNRDFSTSERLGSQGFAAGESALGRRFSSEEAEKGRGWQSGESEKQRGWQSGESALGRAFATSEREAGQKYSTGEREGAQAFSSWREDIGRGFQRSEREAAQGFASGERQAAQGFQQKQFDIGNSQWAQQFQEDKDINAFNQNMANKMSRKSGLEALSGGKNIFGNGKDSITWADYATFGQRRFFT